MTTMLQSRLPKALSAVLAFCITCGVAGPLAFAQAPPQQKPAPRDPAPGDRPDVIAPEPPKTASKAPPPGQRTAPVPKSPAEREKALNDLYAMLATSDSEDTAKAIAEGIERIWLHSGSVTIDLLMERAMKAVAEKKLDLGIKLLDRIVDLAPDYAEAWNRRAYALFMHDETERAMGDLRRALALDPHHFKALDGLSQVLRELGQKKAALKAMRQLLEVHPFWPGAQHAADELSREVEGQGI